MRRQIPLMITFVVGITMILAAFVPREPFNRLDSDLTDFFNILAAFAFVLGAGNLAQLHLDRVSRRKKGWGYSVVTLTGFFFTLVVGFTKVGNPEGLRGALDHPEGWFQQIYDIIYDPLSSTMFSLLAFYVASASYRAFRAKNREATLLLLTAFIALLGRTPVGALITQKLPGIIELSIAAIFGWLGWSSLKAKNPAAAGVLWTIAAVPLGWFFYAHFFAADDVGFISIPGLFNWILINPQLAGQRAVMIGICLGVISMSLRIILGVERSYLGSDGD